MRAWGLGVGVSGVRAMGATATDCETIARRGARTETWPEVGADARSDR